MSAIAPRSPAQAAEAAQLHAIRFKRLRGLTFVKIIELAIHRLNALVDQPGSPQWLAIFGGAPLPGGKERKRRKRRDGATNVLTLLSALVASADIDRGLVARPVNGYWQRKAWPALDTLAYGKRVPGARGMRRTERGAAEVIALEFVRSVPWRVQTEHGIRSVPGLKFVTDKLWKALGLWAAVKSERRQRKQRIADEKKAALESVLGRTVKHLPTGEHARRPQVRAQAAAAPQVPTPARPPPRDGERRAIPEGVRALPDPATAKKILGLK